MNAETKNVVADTLQSVKELQAAGASDELATAIVKTVASLTLHLATKDDLHRLGDSLRTEFHGQLVLQMRWFVGTNFVLVGLVIAAMKWFV